MEKECEEVFVYGTLKYQLVRLFVMRSLVRVRKAILTDYRKEGLTIHKELGATTKGYLMCVTKKQLERLDVYEKLPLLYKRVKVLVEGRDVWVYIKL